MINLIKTNYERELDEKKLIDVSLNRVFLGFPDTRKTTVAKLYSRILTDIGMLSNSKGKFTPSIQTWCLLILNVQVVVKNLSDFVGNVIRQSEANTKAILATTVGKVLIIDEAYMLYLGSGSGGGTGTDIYKTAVTDTIVPAVQSVPGDDRCVLSLDTNRKWWKCSKMSTLVSLDDSSSRMPSGSRISATLNCRGFSNSSSQIKTWEQLS